MTGLLGGSLFLVTAAAVLLGIGWITANGVLVWLSIFSSAGTAVLLALALSRSRAELGAAARHRPPARAAGAATAPFRPESPARARVSPNDAEVVAVPDRRKFHRPDCRYARVRGAERMTRSAARRRSFDACGICKP